MSGVEIIGALLMADAAVTAAVPASRIKAGVLPENAALPSLLVRSISTVERQKLKRVGMVRCVERVSVTVRAGTYAEQGDIRKLLPSACAGRTGTIAGASGVSVLTAGAGPDVDGPGGSFERAQDFRVTYETPA